MLTLTRRRDPDARHESWRVFYGDIQIGTIGRRSGVPVRVDQWQWACPFCPVSHRGERGNGTAADFSKARIDFEAAWRRLLPKVTEADFTEHRRERARTAWKYEMWSAGCMLPTQSPEGRSRCFCGATLDIRGASQHVYAEHME
jgi:hypothetical protein